MRDLDRKQVINVLSQIELCAKNNKTIFIIGNGGSAATASHMATDLMFSKNKTRLKILSLSENNSIITATGNDIDFNSIFSRQLESLASEGDLLILISASGNSKNLIDAVICAKNMGMTTVGFLGFDGGKLLSLVDFSVYIKSEVGEYGPVEDMHLIVNHILKECLSSSRAE
jgi:D-sedoheptulose 7-phosphate isomerase